jgi:hypothetical protein
MMIAFPCCISRTNKAPAAVPFPSGRSAVSAGRRFVSKTNEPASRQQATLSIKRPPRLPCRSADGPTAQVRNAVTTTLITNHKASGRGHKRDAEEWRQALQTPGHSRPTGREPRFKVQHGAESRNHHEIRASASAALEQDKEVDNCAQFRRNQTVNNTTLAPPPR